MILQFVDTHTHIYSAEFEKDRKDVIEKAIENGVSKMLLPNVDLQTIEPLKKVCEYHPRNCFPMLGLHPTSVKEDYSEVLDSIGAMLQNETVYGIGEIGIDLYWDKTFEEQQKDALKTQLQWALQLDLPVAIHARNSLDQLKEVFQEFRGQGLKGVMHCFPGDEKQADWFLDFGFYLGIGGVVTFKKSKMARVVNHVPLSRIILETDAPYLTPEPYRGKRNEPAYIPFIAQKVAGIKEISTEHVAKQTTSNAIDLFEIDP